MARRKKDDIEDPIKKSKTTVFVLVSLIILFIMVGALFIYWGFTADDNIIEMNLQRIIISAIALLVIIISLIVYLKGLFKTNKKKRSSSKKNKRRKKRK